MQRSPSEVFQHLRANHSQIYKRRIAKVKVGPWELLEVLPEHLLLMFTLINRHSRNRSQVDVRVDQSGNQILSVSGDYRCSRRCLRPLISLDPRDAPVFDQQAAFPDVIEALWGDDDDIGDPNSICTPIRTGIS